MAVGYEFDVFIIYAKADEAWVMGYLVNALDQAGVRTNYPEKFELGLPELSEFERGIKSSQRTLLVISHAHNADYFGQFVASMSQTHGLESGTWPLIPMLLNDVPLPSRLALLVKLDATTPEKREKAISRLCNELKTEVKPSLPIPPCPYRGMLPYQEKHSANFYGRESELSVLKDYLRISSIYAVIGPSGSGKSSLIKAGLLPLVRSGKVFLGIGCQIKEVRFGNSPSREALVSGVDFGQINQANHLFVFIDQFEEIFAAEIDRQRDILDDIKKLSEQPFCHVVFTMRADSYAELMESCLWSLVRLSKMEIGSLTQKGLKEAIMRPAEKVGVYIEAALIERLVTEASDGSSVLPFLQETMVLLWGNIERRYLSLDAYHKLILPYKNMFGDGISAFEITMSRSADAALSKLTSDQVDIARRVFLQLVRFDAQKTHSRRQQALKDLVAAKDSEADFKKTIDCLVGNRLLVLSNTHSSGDDVKVDISHEALINGWGQLQEWIEKYGKREKLRRYLQLKVNIWKQLGEGDSGLLDKKEYDFLQEEIKKESDDGSVKSVKEDLSRDALYFLDLSMKIYNPGWNFFGVCVLISILAIVFFDVYAVYYLGNVYLDMFNRFILLVSFIFASLFFVVLFFWLIKRERALLQKSSWWLVNRRSVMPVLLCFGFSFYVFYHFAFAKVTELECNAAGIHKGVLVGATYGINESSLNKNERNIFTIAFRRFYMNFASVVGLTQEEMDTCKDFFEFSFDLDVEDKDSTYFALLRELDDEGFIPNISNPVWVRGNNRCVLLYELANAVRVTAGYELFALDSIPPSQNLDCNTVMELSLAVNDFYNVDYPKAFEKFHHIHEKYPDDQLSMVYMFFISLKYPAYQNKMNVSSINEKSEYPYVNYILGEYYFDNNQLNKAISYYGGSLDIPYPWGELKMSYIFSKQGDIKKGKFYYDAAKNKLRKIKGLLENMKSERKDDIYKREKFGIELMSKLIGVLFGGKENFGDVCEDYNMYNHGLTDKFGSSFIVSSKLFDACP